jgi:carbamoylphosphate synthase small subunit
MIGNYGVPDRKAVDKFGLPAFFESDRIWVEGVVVQDYSRYFSHWNAVSSLGDWLRESGVPGVGGIDTRLLAKKIRGSGALLGKIIFDGGSPLVAAPFLDPNRRCASTDWPRYLRCRSLSLQS